MHPIEVLSRVAKSLSFVVCLLLLVVVMPTVGLCHVAKANGAAAMTTCNEPCCPGQHGQAPQDRDQQTRSCDVHCFVPFSGTTEASENSRHVLVPMLKRVLPGGMADVAVFARAGERRVPVRPPDQPAYSPLRI